MVLGTIAKAALTFVLGVSLAGCIDATIDLEVTSASTAKATLTQVMGADFYGMMKVSAAESETKEDGFCSEGALTENADGSATCIITEEGAFAALSTLGGEENAMTFTPAGPGLVRVSLPTSDLTGELGEAETMDAETRQMVEAFFSGHTITIRIAGGEITETNMDLSKDKTSAETVLPFLDLINGTADLPKDLFAVVRVP